MALLDELIHKSVGKIRGDLGILAFEEDLHQTRLTGRTHREP